MALSCDHFYSFIPKADTDLQWLEGAMKQIVVNYGRKWAETSGTQADLLFPTKPTKAIKKRVRAPVPPTRAQVTHYLAGTTIVSRKKKGEPTVADLMEAEERDTVRRNARRVQAAMCNHLLKFLGHDSPKCAYGMGMEMIGGTEAHRKALQRTVFVIIPDQELPLQTTELIKHLEAKYSILIAIVPSFTAATLSTYVRRERPEWRLQSLYWRVADKEIKEEASHHTKKKFAAQAITIGEFKDRWLYLITNPGTDIVLKATEVSKRNPHSPLKILPSNWQRFTDLWKQCMQVYTDPLTPEDLACIDPEDEKIPPIIPLWARPYDSTVHEAYQKLKVTLAQTDPICLYKQYREPFGNEASASLFKALAEGDGAFDQPQALLPHCVYGLQDVGRMMELGLPCLLAPKPVAKVVRDLVIGTTRPNGSKNIKIAPCMVPVTVAVDTAMKVVVDSSPGKNFQMFHITILFPTTMSVPETWMRGALVFQKIQKDYEDLATEVGATMIYMVTGLEAHFGQNTDKQEMEEKLLESIPPPATPGTPGTKGTTAGVESDHEPDSEQAGDQKKQEKVPTFQAAAPDLAKGRAAIARKNCAGACHIHTQWLYIVERSKSISSFEITNRLAKYTYAGGIKVQVTGTQISSRMKGMKNKDMDVRMTEVCNVSKCFAYICKDSTVLRALTALHVLGCSELVSTVRVSVYHSALSNLHIVAREAGIPIHVQMCCQVIESPESAQRQAITNVSPMQAAQIGTLRRMKQEIMSAKPPRGDARYSALKIHTHFKHTLRDPVAYTIPRSRVSELTEELDQSFEAIEEGDPILLSTSGTSLAAPISEGPQELLLQPLRVMM